MAIVQAYSAWIALGRPKKKSPIPALMKTFDCERTYPKKLYDRVMKSGSVESSWAGCRPTEFSPACWEAMVTLIREHRAKHRVASSRDVSSSLKKVPGRAGKKGPNYTTVQRATTKAGKAAKGITAAYLPQAGADEGREGRQEGARPGAHPLPP